MARSNLSSFPKKLSVALLLVAAACSSAPAPADSDDDPKGDAGTDASTQSGTVIRFRVASVYSGFDGEHTYKAPVIVDGAGDDVKVTVDNDAATITPTKLSATGTLDSGRYFMLTVKKSGDFTLTATSGGAAATAKLSIAPYTTARWTKGQARYTNGGANGLPPCTQCHSTTGVDHSPAALAGINDRAVGLVITDGIAPNGFPIEVDHPSGHKWTVDNDERDGLITYLRSLEPRGFAP